MSQFVEIASKLEEQQVGAVKQSQDAFLKLVETIATNAPSVDVPVPVAKALKPAYAVFGSPDEVQTYMVEAARTWTKLNHDFQNAVVAQLTKIAS